MEASSISFVLRDAANNTVAGQVTYNPATRTVTFNPNSDLALSATYTAMLSGVTDAGRELDGRRHCPGRSQPTNVVSNASLFEPTAMPATLSAVGPESDRSRNEVPHGHRRIHHRNPVLQGGRKHRYPRRPLVGRKRHLLATVTFTNETGSGWQQANFSTPVASHGQHDLRGLLLRPERAATRSTANYFAFGRDQSAASRRLSNAEGGNGVYRYVTGGGYPTSTFNSSNYWVDVVFSNVLTDSSAPTVTARTPAANATGVGPATNVSATFNESVQSGTITFTLRNAANNLVPAAVTYDDATHTVNLDPAANLALSTTYTATLSGAKDAAGNTMAALSWSFTTLGDGHHRPDGRRQDSDDRRDRRGPGD